MYDGRVVGIIKHFDASEFYCLEIKCDYEICILGCRHLRAWIEDAAFQ